MIEPVPLCGNRARARRLLVVAIAEGVSLGAVTPPADADIVAMEAQSLACRQAMAGLLPA